MGLKPILTPFLPFSASDPYFPGKQGKVVRILSYFTHCLTIAENAETRPPALPVHLLSLAQRSTTLHSLAVARRCAQLLLYFCQAGAAQLLLYFCQAEAALLLLYFCQADAAQLLLYFCQADAALLLLPCSEHQRARPGPGSHLIQDRLQDFFIHCALYYHTSWIMCRKCFLMQEEPATRTSLQFLCWCNLSFSSMILTRAHSFPFFLAL